MTNVIVIPFTILVAPFAISMTNSMGDDLSYYVTDEGKRKFKELEQQYYYAYYIIPPVMTNVIVLAVCLAVGYKYKKETERMIQWANEDRENHKKDIEERYKFLSSFGQTERKTPI